MAYNALNNLIDAYIYPNGVQAITGSILNNVLKTMVSQLGGGYNLMGVAAPASSPAVNDEPQAYLAATAGTYTNFDGIVLAAGEVAVLLTSGNGSWSKHTIYTVPTDTADLANTAGFITNAVNDLVNYYTKTEIDTTLADYYDKDDVDDLLENAGNGEDIDANANGKLKFANRVYDALNPDGLGYKILRKDATFASQVTDTNTIYEIRYDYDLNNASITIPAGCVLKFNGGTLSNGTIVGTSTKIDAPLSKIMGTDISMTGSWNVKELFPEWFGAKGDDVADDTAAIQKTIDNARPTSASGIGRVKLLSGHTYRISNSLRVPANIRFGGDSDTEDSRGGWFRPCIHQTVNKDGIVLYGGNYSSELSACRISIQDLLIIGVPYENNTSSAIHAYSDTASAFSQARIMGVCVENWKYGIDISTPTCLSVEISKYSTSNNTVGIGVYTDFTSGCWGMWIKDSYIAFTRICGIFFRAKDISGPLNITNTYIESCGNEYSLDTYNTFGCFGVKIYTTGDLGGLVNIDKCYFESNCPTRSYGDGTLNNDNPYGLIEVANDPSAKERYIYISNPDFEKTAELIVAGGSGLVVNVTNTHFSVNTQTVSIVGGGDVNMDSFKLYRPNRGVDELFQDSLIKIFDSTNSCKYISVRVNSTNVDKQYSTTFAIANITRVIELMSGTYSTFGKFNINYQPTGEKYEYYSTPDFYYGDVPTFYIDANKATNGRGLLFDPFNSLSGFLAAFSAFNNINKAKVVLLSDITVSGYNDFPSGVDFEVVGYKTTKAITGGRFQFNNSKVVFRNITFNLSGGVVSDVYNTSGAFIDCNIVFNSAGINGIFCSEGASKLSLYSCTITVGSGVSAGDCKINRKFGGSVYTKLVNCTNTSDVGYVSDDI